MRSLIHKEFSTILSNWAGMIGILTFYVVANLFLWVFPGSSFLSYGYADPDLFFNIAAWLLLFILPILTINFFSDEFKTGTIEILHSLPIHIGYVIGSKYVAGLLYCLILIVCSGGIIWVLGDIGGNTRFDMWAMLGSYLGIFLLSSCYIAIALFASVLTEEVAISFIVAIILGFVFYSGFSFLADLPIWSEQISFFIRDLGFYERAIELSKGLLPLSTILYLCTITTTFLIGTYYLLTHKLKAL